MLDYESNNRNFPATTRDTHQSSGHRRPRPANHGADALLMEAPTLPASGYDRRKVSMLEEEKQRIEQHYANYETMQRDASIREQEHRKKRLASQRRSDTISHRSEDERYYYDGTISPSMRTERSDPDYFPIRDYQSPEWRRASKTAAAAAAASSRTDLPLNRYTLQEQPGRYGPSQQQQYDSNPTPFEEEDIYGPPPSQNVPTSEEYPMRTISSSRGGALNVSGDQGASSSLGQGFSSPPDGRYLPTPVAGSSSHHLRRKYLTNNSSPSTSIHSGAGSTTTTIFPDNPPHVYVSPTGTLEEFCPPTGNSHVRLTRRSSAPTRQRRPDHTNVPYVLQMSTGDGKNSRSTGGGNSSSASISGRDSARIQNNGVPRVPAKTLESATGLISVVTPQPAPSPSLSVRAPPPSTFAGAVFVPPPPPSPPTSQALPSALARTTFAAAVQSPATTLSPEDHRPSSRTQSRRRSHREAPFDGNIAQSVVSDHDCLFGEDDAGGAATTPMSPSVTVKDARGKGTSSIPDDPRDKGAFSLAEDPRCKGAAALVIEDIRGKCAAVMEPVKR